MNRFTTMIASVALAGAVASSATASCYFSLRIQERSVSGSASAERFMTEEIDEDSASAIAMTAGLFDATALAEASVSDASSSAEGTQESEILIDGFNVSGSVFAEAGSGDVDALADCEGRSDFNVTFRVLVDSTFTLTGEIFSGGNFKLGESSLELVNLSTGVVYDRRSNGNDDTRPIDTSGPLPAGDYELIILASASGFGEGFLGGTAAQAGFRDIEFRIQNCVGRGDLDGDGFIGAVDLAMLLGDFGTVGALDVFPCSADLNRDGSVGATDLSTLVGNWGLCP